MSDDATPAGEFARSVGEALQELWLLVLRRFQHEPNCRPNYVSCKVPMPPSELDIYGKGSRIEDYMRWALQNASCWQYDREFDFLGKEPAWYVYKTKEWRPALRIRRSKNHRAS